MQPRSTSSIYAMLDLYYRLHWWLNNANREEQSANSIILLNVVKERRKALEWILDYKKQWGEMELSI